MTDYLSLIKQPITEELSDFIELFNQSLDHEDGVLGQALIHIRQRSGKRMRPMLILLMAKNLGKVSLTTQYAAVGLELLHTASLVHDDVVDESGERRGQASINASYNNKVAVLVGDYILSTALLNVAKTGHEQIIQELANLGRILSDGEILQLTNTSNQGLSEEIYYQVIEKKTAALFEACCSIAALSVGIPADQLDEIRDFGRNVGIIFQIRDDIFDYYDSKDIGKPTGNDMLEGKLTLPVLYALNSTNDEAMIALAKKVKESSIKSEEIAELVQFTLAHGGIEYAEKAMMDYHERCMDYIRKHVSDPCLKVAFTAYLDFVIQRNI